MYFILYPQNLAFQYFSIISLQRFGKMLCLIHKMHNTPEFSLAMCIKSRNYWNKFQIPDDMLYHQWKKTGVYRTILRRIFKKTKYLFHSCFPSNLACKPCLHFYHRCNVRSGHSEGDRIWCRLCCSNGHHTPRGFCIWGWRLDRCGWWCASPDRAEWCQSGQHARSIDHHL